MEFLESINKYCRQDMIDNILAGYPKIVGIESDLDLINENNKCVGKILLLVKAPKLYLDEIVQFNKNKIKWKSSKYNDEKGFYIIDPYWVRSYAPEPKIKVPIKIRVKNQIVIEMRSLNYRQFQQSKLTEFYYTNKVPHILVAAYQNFYIMNRPGQYYKAINSTVRNYFITQDQLVHCISRFNQEKNRIKNEWNKHLNNYLHENNSAKLIDDLFKIKEVERSKSNVIPMRI